MIHSGNWPALSKGQIAMRDYYYKLGQDLYLSATGDSYHESAGKRCATCGAYAVDHDDSGETFYCATHAHVFYARECEGRYGTITEIVDSLTHYNYSARVRILSAIVAGYCEGPYLRKV